MLIKNKSRWFLMIIGWVVSITLLPLFASAQSEPSPQNIIQSAIFETAIVEVTDLAGNLIGEANHSGEAWCINENCNKKTLLEFDNSAGGPITIEYRFQATEVLNPDAGIIIVSGTGTLSTDNGKERFRFTAAITDNGDGTLFVIYNASRQDASFTIASAPGTFDINNRP